MRRVCQGEREENHESIVVCDIIENTKRLRFSSMTIATYPVREQSIQLLLRIPGHWEIVRTATHCLSLTFHHCKQKEGVIKKVYVRKCVCLCEEKGDVLYEIGSGYVTVV